MIASICLVIVLVANKIKKNPGINQFFFQITCTFAGEKEHKKRIDDRFADTFLATSV
ncbi:hypothetical protein BACCOPRO_03522 [Phocaeicola coprophilus DSM 18228 = JCM 13818]|uniref:Uncharacterized protein n=1 Tax=Phocaeicola coprophilus DSM 18228 = JCM 13818 TaxID=547042 RepID=S0FCI0_9BACT|nr:hypothetical protein BACCOPRO_03522 [Phocaeicola coprophilus DSM 18228 = JCM 13818]